MGAGVSPNSSDAAAWAVVEADITQSVAGDGPAATLAATMASASVLVAQNSAAPACPDSVWMGLISYGVRAGLVDGAGRPMFPFLGSANGSRFG
jgi:hypothetical protein